MGLRTLKDGSRKWTAVRWDMDGIVADGQPGDRLCVREFTQEEDWRALRNRLAVRGLVVVSVGKWFFLAGPEAEAELPTLRQLAAAAAGRDRVARRALRDLTLDLFGEVKGLADSFVAACEPAGEQAEADQDEPAVKGGPLAAAPGARAATPLL